MPSRLPLPSYIHYELLLQLLERQTLPVLDSQSVEYQQVHDMIVFIRKAMSTQKHLEENCDRHSIAIDYRWSLTNPEGASSPASESGHEL